MACQSGCQRVGVAEERQRLSFSYFRFREITEPPGKTFQFCDIARLAISQPFQSFRLGLYMMRSPLYPSTVIKNPALEVEAKRHCAIKQLRE